MWLRHPWIATVHRSLPSFGPNQLRLIEGVMGALDAHVSITENLGLMAILTGYVEGAVREEISWAQEVRRSGLSESEWMTRSSPRVHQLLERGQYSICTKIATEARQPHLSRDDQFRYGLERVLDCIAAALPSTAELPMSAHRRGTTNGTGRPARSRRLSSI
ncbi:TetR/AcrR family transcriptional regulator C-terminal domain-containing protein [Nonomuraea dietziae]|uniref:TetR/AcrR family transcriptional regulator C-terminal domain-containing protein n=1 Tax=Nonomuraea dietziae TaxID=65515 RepID=UPI0033D59F38